MALRTAGELVLRSRQRCRTSRVTYTVSAAALTPSKRDVLLFCRVAGEAGDPHSFDKFAVQVRPRQRRSASLVLRQCFTAIR